MSSNSLFVRLTATFALVILIVIAIIFAIVNQATTNEFRTYMFRGQMSQSDQVARELAAYYTARGGWQGVDQYLAQALDTGMGTMMGPLARNRGLMGMMNAPLFLADANGVIIASGDGSAVGLRASAVQLDSGTPIEVRGLAVGTLISPSSGAQGFDSQQEDFLQRVNLSLLIAGSVAGLTALAFGSILFYQITSPLNALAAASRTIAKGDLSARVARPRDDEIGQVGRAFNAMADSLAQSEAARRNIIADIAHELRNPLGVIQGQLEGMLDGVFPMTGEQIASIHDETLLLTRLVDDLRELALADAGQLRITRQPTHLGALVEKAVNAFAPQAAEKGIALKTNIADALPLIDVDAQRIEQVLRNLIGNALRYTPSNGTVTVEVNRAAASSVRVHVHDTGPGIPSEELAHVFERFWRGDKSRSRTGGGAGLGLAIAQQLVAAHRGTIGVESGVGGGTTFWFTLPLQ